MRLGSLVLIALVLFAMPVDRARGEQAARGKTARPNILFVLCDDLRWDCLGCAGHPQLKTPHIDRLAKEGVFFQNAFCTTSLCSPSRASILSGHYAHSHGVTNNFTEYPTDLASFPKLLQAAGYETAYLGKWHMGEDNDEKRPGFDYFVTHKGQGKYFDTEFNLNGQRREVIPGYYTTVVTDLAVKWLAGQFDASHGKPWVMMLGHKAPHSFYFPEEKYQHAFDSVEVKYPDSAFALDDKPKWIKDRLPTWHGIYGPLFEWRKKFPDDRPEAVKDFAAMTRAYWGTILSVDDSVGRLTAWLAEHKYLDNTVVVFMGDNGLLNGEHGMVDKRTMHEPSIRIPLIVRYPGLSATDTPKKITQQVLTVDMAPSLLDLCGVKVPDKLHGKSWKRLVQTGSDPSWRRSFLYHYNYEKQFPYTPNVRGVRTDEWKYIHYPHGDGKPDRHLAELYDLKSDPAERHNLIAKPEPAAKLRELQAELNRLLLEVGIQQDKMPLDEGIKQQLPDQKIR
ncbi:MAG: sulfatase [Planctomycetota bacterium]